ncbi:MAG: hypothetical protein HZC25_10235 [Rhodospirillales bacterium]|nr:hypothetical protein [Rhodospirillales bacterium]
MTIRLWYQSTVEIDTYHAYREALMALFTQIADRDTTITLRGTPPGTWGGLANSDVMASAWAYHRILSPVLFDNARQAEREGYDAFVLGSFTDPWLRELRSLLDIPVVSLPESTLLTACSVAAKFALVTMNTENDWFLRNNVARYGLESRVSGIHVVEPGLTEWELNTLFTDPSAYLARFTEVARRAIAQYADAIIPAEGLVATVVARHGLREIEGVPVVDAIACAVTQAEAMVKLVRRTGLHAGRRWHYTKAPEAVVRFIDGRANAAKP